MSNEEDLALGEGNVVKFDDPDVERVRRYYSSPFNRFGNIIDKFLCF